MPDIYFPEDGDDFEVEGAIFDQLQNMGFMTPNKESASKDKIAVYLAGPMEVDLDATEKPYSVIWRESITSILEYDPENFWDIRNPTKGKLNSSGLYEITDDNRVNFNSYVIVKNDTNNVRDCDIFLCNLTQEIISVGTMVELGIAYENKKFILLVLPTNSKLREHPFIKEISTAIVSSVKEAADLLILSSNEF